MNTLKYILPIALSAAGVVGYAQETSTASVTDQQTFDVSGVILDDNRQPVADAILTSPGHKIVRTDADGKFTCTAMSKWAVVHVQAQGFFNKEFYVKSSQSDLNVYLIPDDRREYNQTVITGISDNEEGVESTFGLQNAARKDFSLGAVTLDKALASKFTGLQTISKGGMTGEGSNLTVRGIRSLLAETTPLVVINGVPYMPDQNESQLLGGYSRSIFQTINPQDIANVTLLTGAEASQWGSMGGNGVLLVETTTPKSDNLDTRVTFSGSFGVNWLDQRLPLMNASEYKGYLSDIAMDYYDNDMGEFFSDFGFMSSPTANMAHLYAYDTNWQDKIYSNSMTNDYLFRVEGGDAIAKYNMSLGYTGDQGVLKDTKSDRFQAQINANVLVTKKWEINANINLAYLNGKYQEQGYKLETNPLLAAYRRAPILSPYQNSTIPDENGVYALLSDYSSYYMGSITNTDFIVSNPVSIINSADGSVRQYDMNSRLQLVYRPMVDLSFQATVGLYTNYDKEKLFVPGIDNNDIVPRFDNYGESDNTVQVGQGNVLNLYYGLSGQYQHTWSKVHQLSAKAGVQITHNQSEYDMATGRNTANDYYQTMGDVQSIGRYFNGYNNEWNWLNAYVNATYQYANYARVGVSVAADGASSVGSDSDRMSVYPGVNAALMLANYNFLSGQRDWLDRLDVYADYSVTGNSRFSSKYGQYYYTSQPYQTIAGIVRANVPNTNLVPEKDQTVQAGIDLSFMQNRFSVKGGYYNTKAEDVLMLGKNSSVLGTSPYYCNDGELQTKGFEGSINIIPFQNKDWRWTVAANITTIANETKSLGRLNEYLTTLSDDAEIITRVGEAPYSFYGYQTKGVYSTSADAQNAGLKNRNGIAYQAGDVAFVDQNNDGIINDEDKVVLGSATPDFYGSIFTSLEYKGFALDLTFAYSKGNEAYNAVRRITESSSDFANQSKSVIRRWQNEGDVTDMPRANYGDKVGNGVLSDRFVEDASYLKLRDVTLSYSWNKKIWGFLQSGTVYVSGQNLLCFTDYRGMDPELAYSNTASMLGVDYGKVSAPKSVKIGVNLHF